MTGRKRAGALLLCIGLVLILSVSTAFIIHEADHDCSGEDCPICRNIAINIRLLCTAGLAALVLPAFRLLPDAHAAYSLRDRYAYFSLETLVRWKIRLND
ncbi:MAG: hypothetical protein ABS897_01325 [Eubacteriales bacterium]